MPLYDFNCLACGHTFDYLVPWQEKESVRCPQCGGEVKELLSGFAVGGGSSSGGTGGSAGGSSRPRFT